MALLSLIMAALMVPSATGFTAGAKPLLSATPLRRRLVSSRALPSMSSVADTAKAIERTFVEAAGGMAFIVATKDAYDDGIMVPALNLELSMCGQNTAGRPLQPDEIDLRTVWMSLVYLTLERVGYKSKAEAQFPGSSVSEELRQKFYTFTYDVVNAKKQGYDLNSLKLEEVFKGGGEERTPMESAVLSQAMRIVFLAIVASEK